MASTSSVRPKKTHKAKEDIISKLPDSLITHILSLLPTKAAVRTSVLSKRWIERWTLITKMDLNDTVFYFYTPKRKKSRCKQSFINFVYRTLVLSKAYNVESFSLFLTNNEYDATMVNTWISCILSRGVKKLHILTNFEVAFSPLTSHSLFNPFNYLEELVLEMSPCGIKVPPCTYIYFVSLKILKLCGVIFTMDKPLHIVLKSLEKFETKNCSWLSAHDVTIDAPLLQSVLIVQDLESVTREPRSCTIKFSASCMKEFTYEGVDGISQPIVLSNPSAASDTFVKIMLHRDGSYVQETGSRTCLLLKQFSQAKRIKFHGSEVLTEANMFVLPRFPMLSHLDLDVITGEVLLSLLQKSPSLNTLVIQEISKCDQELLNSAAVPECLASSLQVMKIGSVRGSEHELFLAKYFMENGAVLERMSFCILSAWLSKSKAIEEFKEKLYGFKKGVSFAILEFYH